MLGLNHWLVVMPRKIRQKYLKPFEKYYKELPWWGKVFHWIKVILAIIAVIVMFLGFAYLVLVVFGLYGFILKVRDFFLLELAHWIFG